MTKKDIIARAEEIMNYPVDLIEWRADYFEDAYNLSAVAPILSGIKKEDITVEQDLVIKNLKYLIAFKTFFNILNLLCYG